MENVGEREATVSDSDAAARTDATDEAAAATREAARDDATPAALEDVREETPAAAREDVREEATTAAREDERAKDSVAARSLRGVFAAVASKTTAYLVAGALAAGLLVGWLQFSTDSICCGDFDGYYHVRWSQLLWQGAKSGDFPPEFKWLPLTTLNARDYVDHHFLFHILQAPFVSLGETRAGRQVAATVGVAPEALGPKISAWLFASLAIFACYWLVVRHRLRYPLLWLVALLGCSAPFLFRMNMTKAMSVSLVLLIVGVHLLFQRKYLWLLPLAFLFTLAYDMFVLLGAAALIWTAVVAWTERRFEWRPLVWTAVGVALGLVVNPYFPANVRLLYQHVAMKATREGFKTAVGNEWYPYDSWDFLRNCAVAFLAMVAGYVAFDGSDRKRAARPLFLLVFSTLLLIANARWRRFAEYWPPFAVLFAAFSLENVLAGARSQFARLPEDVLAELRPYIDAEEPQAERREAWQLVCAAVAAVALCVPLAINVIAETEEIAGGASHADYRAGAEWMRHNVPAGETVFNTDWDDFPKLFFYDPTHLYVSGLDPTYLYDRSPELSKLYEDITLGREKDPGPLIRRRFGARYVFTDNEDVHDAFYDAAMDSGWFDEVYTDESCTVLRIRDEKGVPPPPAEDDGDDRDNGRGGDAGDSREQ